MSVPSKKRSHSTGRTDLSTNEKLPNDIYQPVFHTIGLFPTTNPATIANTNHSSSTKTTVRPKILQYIEDNIIGKDHTFQGPWGLRRSMIYHLVFLFIHCSSFSFSFKVLYCDYTASGRPLQFIENYIRTHVLPL